jgi:FtsH-binding integral membrane protein
MPIETKHYERIINPGLIGIDEKKLAKQISYTYFWMVFGLLTTALSSLIVYHNHAILDFIFSSKSIFYSLIGIQFFVIFAFGLIANTCRPIVAFVLYLTYAILMGVTLSCIFLVYQLPSIINIFISTAIAFFGLSCFGLFTKRSLTSLGHFCITGLFGMVGLLFIFLFFPSTNTETANLVWSAVGVIVFSGLIAYDSQKLKEYLIRSESLSSQVGTINAALFLYLDFINLFLNLLRIFGSRK